MTYWLAKLEYLTYLVVVYIMIFVICLVILDICYVSYSFTKKKFAFVWPLQVLRSVCGLFVTTLFLPLLESFISIIHCMKGNGREILQDSTGGATGLYLNMFPTVQCWTGAHIIHATFAIVVAAIFISICLIVSLTFFDSNSNS